MSRQPGPPMTGGYLDRDASTRLDPAALDAAWHEDAARVMRLRAGSVALSARDEQRAVLELHETGGQRPASAFYLGRLAGAPRFALVVAEPGAAEPGADETEDAPEPAQPEPAQPAQPELPRPELPQPEPTAGWHHPFTIGSQLSPADAEMLAVALALAAWHTTAQYSPRDGQPTEATAGGWARIDPHGAEHFPRTDPVVIVLVEHEGRALLGSNALWETGRFSLLAGFIEAGESAEDAVAREVLEESGAVVDDIRYIASQPWPFPRSFMLGFRARLAPGCDPAALVPDPGELSELRWFTRDELRTPPPGVTLPMPMSIARWLIDGWVAEGDRVADGR